MDKIKNICSDILNCEEFFDCLEEEVFNQVTSDEDTPMHKYSRIVKEYLEGNDEIKRIIDNVFIAFSGWRLCTLLENAYKKFSSAEE